MKSLFTGLLLIGILLDGCSYEESPPNLIEEDTYINLLVEMQLVKTYRQGVPADSSKVDSLKQHIYAKYNVTEEQFRLSHEFYQQEPAKQKERVDMAIEQLRMDQIQSDTTQPRVLRKQ